jgi:hypothetical protein
MRLKHGHLDAGRDDAPAPPEPVSRRPFQLLLQSALPLVPVDGYADLTRLLDAYDGQQSLPIEPLQRLMDALRVFLADGEHDERLREFAARAGLAAASVARARMLGGEVGADEQRLFGHQFELLMRGMAATAVLRASMRGLDATLSRTLGNVVDIHRAMHRTCAPHGASETPAALLARS